MTYGTSADFFFPHMLGTVKTWHEVDATSPAIFLGIRYACTMEMVRDKSHPLHGLFVRLQQLAEQDR